MKGKKVFKLNMRVYIYFITAVVLLSVLVVLLTSGKGNNRISLFYSPSENGAVVLSDGKNTGRTVPGNNISCVRYNSDSTFCAVLMSDGDTYSLYNVDAKEVKKIADNCTSDFVCSFKGKKNIYMTSDGFLYSDKKLIDESVNSFAVSPDCSCIIYSKKEENTNKLYLSISGKTTLVNENYVPLAVTDKGESLYVISGDNSLCILNADGTMKSKLCSDVQTDAFRFSDDLSSIVFSDGSYTYISVEGKSRIRLIPGKASPVLPESEEMRLNSQGTAFICDDDSLTDIFYSAFNDDGTEALFYVNDDFGRTDIAGSVKKFVITGDDTLSYLDSQGKIYKYNGNLSELVVSGANDFEATSSNRYIYYMTTGKELYSVKGSNVQLIASDAEKMCMTGSDKLLFIMTDKNLYSVSGAKRSDILGENASFCTSDGDISFYASDYNSEMGTFDLFSSVNGRKFRFAAQGVVKQ